MARTRRGNGQGSLFKRTPRGCWIASWYDHDGKRKERSTRTTDKASAERILRKLVSDAALRTDGVIDARAEAVCKQGQRPIAEHMADFERWLHSKGNTSKHVAHMVACLKRMVSMIQVETLPALTPAAVLDAVGQRHDDGVSARTCNMDLRAVKSFTRWAVRDGRLTVDPLVGLPTLNESTDRRRQRRPLNADELALLIDAAQRGPVYRRMSGPDRAMLYRLATGTGFRAGEIASLTPASFDLDADPPTVTVRAAYSKHRRDDLQPIRNDLADVLRGWLAGRPADRPVFDMPDKLARVVRADLRRARARWIRSAPEPAERRERLKSDFLAVTDAQGRVVDFHALRATYITLLVKGGAPMKVAQDLARHSDPKLTMNVYTMLGIHDLTGALDSLPGETPSVRDDEPMRATGTCDAMPAESGSADPRSRLRSSSANPHHPAQRSASHREDGPLPFDARKSLRGADQRSSARSGAAARGNAPRRTRTFNPLIKSQLLCQLS